MSSNFRLAPKLQKWGTNSALFYIYIFLALYPVSPTGSSLSLNTLGRGSQLYSEEPWVPLEMPQSYLGEEKRKKSSSQCSRVDTPDSIWANSLWSVPYTGFLHKIFFAQRVSLLFFFLIWKGEEGRIKETCLQGTQVCCIWRESFHGEIDLSFLGEKCKKSS